MSLQMLEQEMIRLGIDKEPSMFSLFSFLHQFSQLERESSAASLVPQVIISTKAEGLPVSSTYGTFEESRTLAQLEAFQAPTSSPWGIEQSQSELSEKTLHILHEKQRLLFLMEKSIQTFFKNKEVALPQKRFLLTFLNEISEELSGIHTLLLEKQGKNWFPKESLITSFEEGEEEISQAPQELWTRMQKEIIVAGNPHFQQMIWLWLYQLWRTAYGRQLIETLLIELERERNWAPTGLFRKFKKRRVKDSQFGHEERHQEDSHNPFPPKQLSIYPKPFGTFDWNLSEGNAALRINFKKNLPPYDEHTPAESAFFLLAEAFSTLSEACLHSQKTDKEKHIRTELSQKKLKSEYQLKPNETETEQPIHFTQGILSPRTRLASIDLRQTAALSINDPETGATTPPEGLPLLAKSTEFWQKWKETNDQELIEKLLSIKAQFEGEDLQELIARLTDKAKNERFRLLKPPHLDSNWRTLEFDQLFKVSSTSDYIGIILNGLSIIYSSLLLIHHISRDIQEFIECKEQVNKKEAVSRILIRIKEMGEITQSVIRLAGYIHHLMTGISHVSDALFPAFAIILSSIETCRRAFQLGHSTKHYIEIGKQRTQIKKSLANDPVYTIMMGERKGIPTKAVGEIRNQSGLNSFLQKENLELPPDDELQSLQGMAELDLNEELRTINRERIIKECFYIMTNLTRIGGNITLLTGVGAHIGLGIKLGAIGTEIGFSVVRGLVPLFRNLPGGNKQLTRNGMHQHRQDLIATLFRLLKEFDGSDILEAKKLATYINACGTTVNKLCKAPTKEEKITALYWGLNERIWKV
ncbi:MAG: hypothetical protein MI784_10885 [Cytophagales bacterium]|nr:hypothetical protein [Cytophagales bacterium]